MKATILPLLIALTAVAACDNDGGSTADGDSTTRFERGVARVGEQIETAAKGVGTEVSESRIQMVIDNIKGMDSVQAEITDDGSITLIGNVASDDARVKAEELVRSIEGVDNVRNSLVVGHGASPDSSVSSPEQPDTAK